LDISVREERFRDIKRRNHRSGSEGRNNANCLMGTREDEKNARGESDSATARNTRAAGGTGGTSRVTPEKEKEGKIQALQESSISYEGQDRTSS